MRSLFYNIVILLLCSFPIHADNLIHGTVIKVADGDTITIRQGWSKKTKIRFHGVDAHEKPQDYGKTARNFVADMVYGKKVSVILTYIDKYYRTVGVIYVDNKCLN